MTYYHKRGKPIDEVQWPGKLDPYEDHSFLLVMKFGENLKENTLKLLKNQTLM